MKFLSYFHAFHNFKCLLVIVFLFVVSSKCKKSIFPEENSLESFNEKVFDVRLVHLDGTIVKENAQNAQFSVTYVNEANLLVKIYNSRDSGRQVIGKFQFLNIVLSMNQNFLKESKFECFYGYGQLYAFRNFDRLSKDNASSPFQLENSWTALTICKDSVEGFLLLEKSGFLIESVPRLKHVNRNNHKRKAKRNIGNVVKLDKIPPEAEVDPNVIANVNEIVNVGDMKSKRNFPVHPEVELEENSMTKNGFFNLTGDTFFLNFPSHISNRNIIGSNVVELKDFSHNSSFPNFTKQFSISVGSIPNRSLTDIENSWNSSTRFRKDQKDEKDNKLHTLHTSHLQLDDDNFTKTSKTLPMGSKPNANTKVLQQTSAEYNNWLVEQDDSDLGYFYDSAWKTVTTRIRKPVPLRNPQRHLEIIIAIDDSVIKFHGRLRVKQYVLTLMNIVNAIYQDPSLEANMQIVIKELYFYEKKRNVIKLGNAKRSLENVNLWNKNVHQNYDDNQEPHDIALWLTRMDIGGPSGYAPVGGVCDPERSCALTRDEGLTCAFIIAHELAHILGLSHDGDAKNNNTCKDEALAGSVMAPIVSATFHHFLWSECSRKEFTTKVAQWQCLLDEPDKKKSIGLNSTLETKFTMDEQCRVEFGEGYSLCRSIDIVEPCAHLWCADINKPLVCKTKNGPPLEGTECGPHKWCIDGYCDSTLRINLDPLKYNSQDGGWSNWGTWAACSRTCGLGMQFRARQCDNPKPAYGGRDCDGLTEEWCICNPNECPEPLQDYRAQQCQRMPRLLDVPKNFTWLPYESDQEDLMCKFICQSGETGEIYASDENFVDGTFCSYDFDNKRCVQGQCIDVGCDHQVNSTVIEDGCGVCDGNNAQCTKITATLTKRIKKQITRLGVLHNQARHIVIELEIQENLVLQDYSQMQRRKINNKPMMNQIDLFLKDRKRNFYGIRKSIHGNYGRWEFHQDGKDRKDQMRQQNDVRDRQDEFDTNENRNSNEYENNGITRTIIQGAMFRYHGYGQPGQQDYHQQDKENKTILTKQTWYLSSKGPILNELILFAEVKNLKKDTLKIKVEFEYLINKKHKESKYQWIIGGWGSCSRSCGGGKMLKTKACIEKQSKRIVARKFCSIINKPPTEIQECNNFSCNFVWIPGEWEPCSVTCGKNGVQTREIYCVPQNIAPSNQTNDDDVIQYSVEVTVTPWKYMIPPIKCGYQPPATSRACARTFCPGHWEFSQQWSKCSSSCDYGMQMREALCTKDQIDDSLLENTTKSSQMEQILDNEILSIGNRLQNDYISCGSEVGPKQYQFCTNPKNNCHVNGVCTGDASTLCGLGSLKRYCKIESFRELCCHSCHLQRLTPIEI